MENKKVNINGIEFYISRSGLKVWTNLGEIQKEMEIAVSTKQFTSYYKLATQFIDTVSSLPQGTVDWSAVPWFDFLEILSDTIILNSPTKKFPILEEKRKNEEKLPWEYDGRAWYFWLNIFAQNYGWSENQIEHLDIDDAIGLYQEIVINEQLQKEWEWGMSEVAYKYDKSSKTSKYQPLHRPIWMLPLAKPQQKIKIRKDMLPVGNIIKLSDLVKKKDGS